MERYARGTFRGLVERLASATARGSAVSQQLSNLGADWHVLRAAPVGERESSVDYVVVGPAGVFVVAELHVPYGRVWVGDELIMVDGWRSPAVRNSRNDADRASQLLTKSVESPVQVAGIVAVVGARQGLTISEQPQDGAVFVVAEKQIGRHLGSLPQRLAAPEIEKVIAAARRSATWA